MSTGNKLIQILFVCLIILFLGGVFKLFDLRFQAGDIYPPYSSFRSDPLGSKVFYESLMTLPSLTVTRNLKQINRIPHDNEKRAFFYLGTAGFEHSLFDEKTFAYFEHTAAVGGRVVVSCLPRTTLENATKTDSETEKKNDPCPCPTDEDEPGDEQPEKEETFQSISERWEFSIAAETEKPEDMFATAAFDSPLRSTMPMVFWPTTRYFKQTAEDWRVIYTKNDRPVIIEKKWGKGSIILLTDSYLFSNEALKKESPAALLAWLVGDSDRIVFDESHLGIQKSPGIASLIRKYNLFGLLGTLVIIAVLFIWKQTAVLVPIHETTGTDGSETIRTGKGNLAGLTNMLKRRYSPADIVRLAVVEWENSPANRAKIKYPATTRKLEQARAVITAGGNKSKRKNDPIKQYNTILKILSE